MSTDGAITRTPLTDALVTRYRDAGFQPDEFPLAAAIGHARKLEGDRAELAEALKECINWFADRADASDEDGRGMRANEEMTMQQMCEAAIARAAVVKARA